MTAYLPQFYQAFAVDFQKQVRVLEQVQIQKQIQSLAQVLGNVGNANSDAKAFGHDTLAETLTLTSAIQGYGSTAFSESTSATNGWGWYWVN
jgi:hypothetical protein